MRKLFGVLVASATFSHFQKQLRQSTQQKVPLPPDQPKKGDSPILALLNALLPILREGENHREKLLIASSLATFVSALSDEDAKGVFDICFSTFFDTSLRKFTLLFLVTFSATNLRLTVLHNLCLPLIHHMSTTTAVSVFSEHVILLAEKILPAIRNEDDEQGTLAKSANFTLVLDAGILAEISEDVLVDRLGSLKMLQAMYNTLGPTHIKTQINGKFFEFQQGKKAGDAKGNELNVAIMKAAHAIKSENVLLFPGFFLANFSQIIYTQIRPSLVLEYHCTAFNTLASVVVCTQTKENFFTTFCFRENSDKGEKLWSNIVDLTVCDF